MAAPFVHTVAVIFTAALFILNQKVQETLPHCGGSGFLFWLPGHTGSSVFGEQTVWFWPPCAPKVDATSRKKRHPKRHLWYVFVLGFARVCVCNIHPLKLEEDSYSRTGSATFVVPIVSLGTETGGLDQMYMKVKDDDQGCYPPQLLCWCWEDLRERGGVARKGDQVCWSGVRLFLRVDVSFSRFVWSVNRLSQRFMDHFVLPFQLRYGFLCQS